MKFTLSGVLCSKLDIVDDAEQTPGASRTITRFRQECAEPIMSGMINLRPATEYTELSEVHTFLSTVLGEHGFKMDKAEFTTDNRDGLERVEVTVHSEE